MREAIRSCPSSTSAPRFSMSPSWIFPITSLAILCSPFSRAKRPLASVSTRRSSLTPRALRYTGPTGPSRDHCEPFRDPIIGKLDRACRLSASFRIWLRNTDSRGSVTVFVGWSPTSGRRRRYHSDGSRWHRVGRRRSIFMPVPSKSQCSGLAQVQSAPPPTGSVERASMRRAGPRCCKRSPIVIQPFPQRSRFQIRDHCARKDDRDESRWQDRPDLR